MTARQEKALLAGLLAAVMPPGFLAVSAVSGAHPIPPPSWLLIPLDSMIPFVPVAVWAYASWYPSSLLILCASREQFRRLCLAEFAAFILCSVVHLAWPVSIERPALDALTGPSASALTLLYAVDKPVSLFPSFHCAVAPILVQFRPPSPLLRLGLVAWMAAICVSCVLTKQHYLLDVVAGLAVGGIAVAIVDAARSWFAQTAKLTPHTVCSVGSQTAE